MPFFTRSNTFSLITGGAASGGRDSAGLRQPGGHQPLRGSRRRHRGSTGTRLFVTNNIKTLKYIKDQNIKRDQNF